MLEGIPPEFIHWSEQEPSLFTSSRPSPKPPAKPARLTVPPAFLKLAETLSYARDSDRWDLLYRILYRLQYENPNLLDISVDPDIHRASLLNKSVRRDIHKMHAFVRFKHAEIEGQEVYVAWHNPEHLIVRAATPFFSRRFGDRRWSIFTPDESAHWDLQQLTFGSGMSQHQFQVRDDWDEVWKTYYRSIFNPSRIKIKAMKLEMSPKYWSSMPETSLIRELVREAPLRQQSMVANQYQSAKVSSHQSWEDLRQQANQCQSCPLHARATQTVFGTGPENAQIMIVGEQPGDQEDQVGSPFVGPAGQVLRTALENLGIEASQFYFTNAVKHFKWESRGKARLHKKPSGQEMHACKPWLEAEIQWVRPSVIIALGTTAATAILGRLPKIAEERGRIITHLKAAPNIVVTWHPSAILRAPAERAANMKQQLHDDLALACKPLSLD